MRKRSADAMRMQRSLKGARELRTATYPHRAEISSDFAKHENVLWQATPRQLREGLLARPQDQLVFA